MHWKIIGILKLYAVYVRSPSIKTMFKVYTDEYKDEPIIERSIVFLES